MRGLGHLFGGRSLQEKKGKNIAAALGHFLLKGEDIRLMHKGM
jgi:hypothetical protein